MKEILLCALISISATVFSANSFAGDEAKIFLDHLDYQRYSDAELMLVDGGQWINNDLLTEMISKLCGSGHIYTDCSNADSVLYRLTRRMVDSVATSNLIIKDIPRSLGRIARIDLSYLKLFEKLNMDFKEYFPREGIWWNTVSGFDIDDDEINHEPVSLLEIAALTGNLPAIKFLIDRGAPISNTNTNIFYRAMNGRYYGSAMGSYGEKEIDDEFLKIIGAVSKTDISSTATKKAFVFAVLTGDFYFAKLLLESGFVPGQGPLPFINFTYYNLSDAGRVFDPSTSTLFSLQVARSYDYHESFSLFDYLDGGDPSCIDVTTGASVLCKDDYGRPIPLEVTEGNRIDLAELILFALKQGLYSPSQNERLFAKKSLDHSFSVLHSEKYKELTRSISTFF